MIELTFRKRPFSQPQCLLLLLQVSDVTGAMKMNDTSLISGQYLKPNAIVTLKQTGNGKTQSRSSLVSGP